MENNNEKKYVLKIYNTVTSCKENVEVSEEVYKEFKRSYWREHKNNQKHRYYEIPFSALTVDDSETDACEFYEEFESNDLPLDVLMSVKEDCNKLLCSVSKKAMKRLILHYYYQFKIEDIAKMEGVSVQAIKNCLVRAKKEIEKNF